MNSRQHSHGLAVLEAQPLFARHDAIAAVLIYGSCAEGNYRAGSDIDLTIKGGEIPFAEFMQIEDQIDDLMLPYTVDLSQYRQLENADLIAHIDRSGWKFTPGMRDGMVLEIRRGRWSER